MLNYNIFLHEKDKQIYFLVLYFYHFRILSYPLLFNPNLTLITELKLIHPTNPNSIQV